MIKGAGVWRSENKHVSGTKSAGVSFLVSVLRGLILSGIMICLLPIAAGPDSLWFAMVITEAAVAVLVISLIRRYTRELPAG